MRLHKFHNDDRINAKRAQAAKLERLTLEALPKLPGAVTLTSSKVCALLPYENQWEPEGAPRSF